MISRTMWYLLLGFAMFATATEVAILSKFISISDDAIGVLAIITIGLILCIPILHKIENKPAPILQNEEKKADFYERK